MDEVNEKMSISNMKEILMPADGHGQVLFVLTAAYVYTPMSDRFTTDRDIEDYYTCMSYRPFVNIYDDPVMSDVFGGMRKWQLQKEEASFYYFFQRPLYKDLKRNTDCFADGDSQSEESDDPSYTKMDLDYAIASLKTTILQIKPKLVVFLEAKTMHLVLQNYDDNGRNFEKLAKEVGFEYDFVEGPLDWMRLQTYSRLASRRYLGLVPPSNIEIKLSEKKKSVHGQNKYRILANSLEKILSCYQHIEDALYSENIRILAIALEFQHEFKYSEMSRKVKYDAMPEDSKEKRKATLKKGRG